MFERFTDRARRVVVLAQEEARTLNHNHIGTEHFLLGLLHEGEGVAAKALTALGVDFDDARKRVVERIGVGPQITHGHIPFTPRGKKVMELALREALQLGHNYIGTEHILLALIREGDGVGAQIMTEMGAELNRTRQQVLQELAGYKPQQGGKDVPVFPPYSADACPKCPSTRVKATYELPRVTYSKTLKRVLSLGEHLRRNCLECGYSWGEACRTEFMAPNSTWTADQDLQARIEVLEQEAQDRDDAAPAS